MVSNIIEYATCPFICTWIIGFITFIIAYYSYVVSAKPKLYTGNVNLRRFLTKHVSTVNQKFWPAFFFWNGQLQTIFGLQKRMNNFQKLPYKREILTMKDGGKIGLDYLFTSNNTTSEKTKLFNKKRKLMVIVLPGLTSSSQTSYVKTIALSIVKFSKVPVVILNNRGLAGVPLETPRTFSATNCDDLREAITHLKEKFPDTDLMAIGTSLGGMILAHYLIEHQKEAKDNLVTGMIISTVWDAWSATRNIERPINLYLINYQLAQSLQQMAKKYRSILERESCFDYSKILSSKTLRQIDECYTAPQFGYKSIEEYYDHVTVANDIDKFPIPIVALSSFDDPMQPGRDLPMKGASECQNLALVVTSRGGHLGFLEGILPFGMKKVHYMEKFIGQYVRGVKNYPEELF